MYKRDVRSASQTFTHTQETHFYRSVFCLRTHVALCMLCTCCLHMSANGFCLIRSFILCTLLFIKASCLLSLRKPMCADRYLDVLLKDSGHTAMCTNRTERLEVYSISSEMCVADGQSYFPARKASCHIRTRS